MQLPLNVTERKFMKLLTNQRRINGNTVDEAIHKASNKPIKLE